MPFTLAVDIRFEAAHRLPHVPATHKCFRLHGHSYRCEVHVQAPLDEAAGWVMDFAALRACCEPWRLQLDHYYLNEISGLENPTSENITRWIWRQLKPALPGLHALVLHETCTARCVYSAA